MSLDSIQQNFDRQIGTVNQRFEIKYLIDEVTARMATDYLTTYMDPDPQNLHYPVTSLYLDDDRMSMFWSSEMGERNRYKLRLRSYTDEESPQVFAEVKRRLDRVILKTRVAVHSERVEDLLAGRKGTDEIVMDPESPKAIRDLQYFRDLLHTFQAKPSTTVRYDREAYVGRYGDTVRLTFDRDLCCIPTLKYSHEIWSDSAFWRTLPQVPVVLEVKFTDRYPDWVQNMIRRLALGRTSMAKYVQCVKTLESEGIGVTPLYDGVVI